MTTDDAVPNLLRDARQPADAIEILTQRFPGLQFWYGQHTGHYYAIADGHRVTAPNATNLYLKLRERRAQ